MRVEYAITLEDFRSVQPPFRIKAGRNIGFRVVVAVCFAMVLLGLNSMSRGLGAPVGFFLIGLGICATLVAYFLDLRSVKSAKQKYEDTIVGAYQRIHCRECRIFETDEAGFTVSCACGMVTRPWSELTSFSENKAFFVVGVRGNSQPVTKSAFASEGAVTEFRALFLGKLDGSRSITARPIDFSYTRADFRHAYLLHVLGAGGWRRLLSSACSVAGFGYVMLIVLRFNGAGNDPAVPYFAFGPVLLFVTVMTLMRRRTPYFGALRIFFGEDGLQIQNPQTLTRSAWNQFIGYLENGYVFLLYSSPRRYQIIPKRALASQEKEFKSLLEAKLARYDYRRPGLLPAAGSMPTRSQT